MFQISNSNRDKNSKSNRLLGSMHEKGDYYTSKGPFPAENQLNDSILAFSFHISICINESDRWWNDTVFHKSLPIHEIFESESQKVAHISRMSRNVSFFSSYKTSKQKFRKSFLALEENVDLTV